MPRKKRNEVLVGAFLCLGTALFLLFLFLMGSLDALFEGTAKVEAEFEDVQGLQTGDPVFLFGRKVGKVSDVELLPTQAGRRAALKVSMRMPARFRPYLRQDSIVKIEKSVTGLLSVLIKESDGNPLAEGERLKGTPATDLATLTDKVSRLLDEGREAVSSLSKIVSDIHSKGDVTAALADIAVITKEARTEILPLKERLKEAIALVKEFVDENRLDIRHTVANLKETTERARMLADKLADTPDQVSRSLNEIEKAGGAVTVLLRENRANIGSIVDELSQTSSNLSNLTADVKRRPWRIFYRPGRAELKDMDLYDAAWAYNLGASELHRSIRDLTATLEGGGDGGGASKDIEDLKKRIGDHLSRQRDVEEVFWEKLRVDG